jgi:hypothetical protein
VCGDPKAMVVAFESKKLNVYAVADAMTHRGTFCQLIDWTYDA